MVYVMFATLLLFIPGLFADWVFEIGKKKQFCVLEGSSVKVSCSFSIKNDGIKEVFFFNTNNKMKWKDTTIPESVSEDEEYYGRLQRSGVAGGGYREMLVITDLRPTDSGDYKCKMNTYTSGWKNSEYGSTVDVTGLKVRSNPDTVQEGQRVTLTCDTKCTLSGNSNPTYIWYKNGQRLTNLRTINNSLYLDSFSTMDSGSYTCVVNDIHSPALCLLDNCWDVRYNKTICAIEGSSVDLPLILTCDSDANPPVDKYIWYKRNGSAVSVLQGETKRYINSAVSLKDQYFCEAHNKIGAQNSTWDIVEDVTQSPLMISVLVVVAVLTTGTLLVFGYYILKRRHHRESQLRSESRENIYADPDEYVNVQDDTYTALQGDPVII
uniref:Ig-like domain-containing protein n=1 Tax=Esox lucius TaxID=8010 RepID=A0AAY5L2P3_ESOLU